MGWAAICLNKDEIPLCGTLFQRIYTTVPNQFVGISVFLRKLFQGLGDRVIGWKIVLRGGEGEPLIKKVTTLLQRGGGRTIYFFKAQFFGFGQIYFKGSYGFDFRQKLLHCLVIGSRVHYPAVVQEVYGKLQVVFAADISMNGDSGAIGLVFNTLRWVERCF